MAMSIRELQRNIGRIPRLLFHIKRLKAGDADAARIKGFEQELERRKLEMKLAGMEQADSVTQAILKKAGTTHEALLNALLAVKLTPQHDAASIGLNKLYSSIFPGETILKPAVVPTKH